MWYALDSSFSRSASSSKPFAMQSREARSKAKLTRNPRGSSEQGCSLRKLLLLWRRTLYWRCWCFGAELLTSEVPVVTVAGIFFASLKRSLEGKPFQKQLKSSPPLAFCVFCAHSAHWSKLRSRIGIKKTSVKHWFSGVFSGERGIRTPGTSRYAGFQDQCIRPLCHLSDREFENSLSGRQI